MVQAADVQLIPLVPNLALPRRASPKVRDAVPAGYGVQEQCLPFTAAAGLGLIVPSPIAWGYCRTVDVPNGVRAFRSPVDGAIDRRDWVFYVHDNPRCLFIGNAYRIESDDQSAALEPGISFFDRADQQELFKLHLPYIWRTAPEVDTLFTPLVNRASPAGVGLLAGLVETHWYANPVNLVARVGDWPIHVAEGDDIAQAILIARNQRRPEAQVAASHSRAARDAVKAWREWHAHHARNRSAYKVLARSHQ
jgi:hypothetical protein